MSNTPQTFIGKAIALIVSLFHKAEPVVDDILDWADKLVDGIKQFVDGHPDLANEIEGLIEGIVPQSTGLINAIKLSFPKVASIISAGKDELDKTDAQKYQDLMDYLKGLKTSDPVLYAGTLNTINAWFQQYFAQNAGVTGLTAQMSLAGAQVKHDETLGTAV